MDLKAFETLKNLRNASPLVCAEHLEGGDRTLMLGYLLSRDSVHVYLRDQAIHRVVSDWRGQQKSHEVKWWWLAEDLLRNQKRWYPERCDQGFCVMVGRAKGWIEFTAFDGSRLAVADGQVFKGDVCGCQMRDGRH